MLEKINPVVYRLRLPDKYPMHPVFNLEHLRLYRPSDPEMVDRATLPDTRDYLNASEEYAILGHATRPRKKGNQRCVGRDTARPMTPGSQKTTCAMRPHLNASACARACGQVIVLRLRRLVNSTCSEKGLHKVFLTLFPTPFSLSPVVT